MRKVASGLFSVMLVPKTFVNFAAPSDVVDADVPVDRCEADVVGAAVHVDWYEAGPSPLHEDTGATTRPGLPADKPADAVTHVAADTGRLASVATIGLAFRPARNRLRRDMAAALAGADACRGWPSGLASCSMINPDMRDLRLEYR